MLLSVWPSRADTFQRHVQVRQRSRIKPSVAADLYGAAAIVTALISLLATRLSRS
jgi:hypothetical protein